MLKENYKDGNDLDQEMNDIRTVKVKDLQVSWKWPVSRVVTRDNDVNNAGSCSKIIRQNKNKYISEPSVLPVHKNVRSCTRGSLPVIEYKKVSWPCTRRVRKLV